MGARRVAAVDCLGARASERQYRRALPLDEAVRWVAEESGKSFDPKVVDVLQRRYRELEQLARKQGQGVLRLSTGRKIENGGGPAAGFEPSATAPPTAKPAFIDSIAAARQEFQALLEITHDLDSSLRVDETLALLASRLKALIPHHCIAIYTAAGSHLVTRYASGEDAALFSSLAIPLGEGISGWVVQNNKSIINGNPSVESGYLNDPTKYSVHRSALSVPLPGIQGAIGALTLYRREAGAFTKDHLRVLMAVSSKVGRTIDNALRFVQAEETAGTDSLTVAQHAHAVPAARRGVAGCRPARRPPGHPGDRYGRLQENQRPIRPRHRQPRPAEHGGGPETGVPQGRLCGAHGWRRICVAAGGRGTACRRRAHPRSGLPGGGSGGTGLWRTLYALDRGRRVLSGSRPRPRRAAGYGGCAHVRDEAPPSWRGDRRCRSRKAGRSAGGFQGKPRPPSAQLASRRTLKPVSSPNGTADPDGVPRRSVLAPVVRARGAQKVI